MSFTNSILPTSAPKAEDVGLRAYESTPSLDRVGLYGGYDNLPELASTDAPVVGTTPTYTITAESDVASVSGGAP